MWRDKNDFYNYYREASTLASNLIFHVTQSPNKKSNKIYLLHNQQVTNLTTVNSKNIEWSIDLIKLLTNQKMGKQLEREIAQKLSIVDTSLKIKIEKQLEANPTYFIVNLSRSNYSVNKLYRLDTIHSNIKDVSILSESIHLDTFNRQSSSKIYDQYILWQKNDLKQIYYIDSSQVIPIFQKSFQNYLTPHDFLLQSDSTGLYTYKTDTIEFSIMTDQWGNIKYDTSMV